MASTEAIHDDAQRRAARRGPENLALSNGLHDGLHIDVEAILGVELLRGMPSSTRRHVFTGHPPPWPHPDWWWAPMA